MAAIISTEKQGVIFGQRNQNGSDDEEEQPQSRNGMEANGKSLANSSARRKGPREVSDQPHVRHQPQCHNLLTRHSKYVEKDVRNNSHDECQKAAAGEIGARGFGW
jgi:hypothetical protein